VAAATDGVPLLEISGLAMRFGGLRALDGLSFIARRGEITAVIGPNGAGKTTAFNCITGFYRPTGGRITLVHEDGARFSLERMAGHRIARRARVARTFQNIRLFAGMTVLENLLVAQHNRLMAATGFGVLAVLGLSGYRAAERAAVEKARHWLDRIGLVARADDPAGALPYGAQRRLEIARAMCIDPVLLCLDEPAAGLNPRETEELNTLLLAIRDGAGQDAGCSLLLIEHDMGVVMRISDHVVVLDHGRKISDGAPEAVRADPAVIAAYLGEGEEDEEEAGEAAAAAAETAA
jgi:branched-chain amino acid transport system ATP-binding protein